MTHRKLFLISPQRCGSRSFVEFFRAHGLSGAHWPGDDFDLTLAPLLDDLCVEGLWLRLLPLVREHAVFGDLPYPCVWRQAARDYPSCEFAILRRDQRSWARSVTRFSAARELNNVERFYYWRAIGRRETNITSFSEEELMLGRDLFEATAREELGWRLATFDLSDPDIGAKIAARYGLPAGMEFPHITGE